MDFTQISLNDFVARLLIYAETFGGCELSSIGCRSDNYHIVFLRDAHRREHQLEIPMYRRQVDAEINSVFATQREHEQFMLLSSCDWELDVPKVFDSVEDAIAEMLRNVGAALHLTPSALMTPEERKKINPLNQFDITHNKAWVDRWSQYNWRICKVTLENGRIARCE